MEFHFLGTGSGVPATKRNVSGLVVRFLQKKSTQWLFDCGEATQHQILNSPVTLSKIDRIFISHLHGDHIFGLPGLLCSRSAQGAKSKLTIYGPEGIQTFVETTLSVSQSYLAYEIEYVVTQEGMIYSDKTITVQALHVDHVMPGFAYKLIEADQPGTLQVDLLKEKGIEPGPIYQQIKRGEVIELPDGSYLNGAEFIGEAKKGRIVVISGDTRPMETMCEFAKDADLLIHEATFRSDKKSHADQFGHSTICDVAKLAKQANVKSLILTHISSRYVDVEEELKAEAEPFFPNTLIAYDFMVHEL
ncbi:ribonuclease Z [Halalkalibacter nanhaiisediminis]|uniref:Ribonuclease Z n=1 Tax=Halalkalibacter nanhaiisediminis TaxID=688079 RepID=A0A562QQH3_9BACI|nr:ribonuclease Z [Halalkalibacter nanhaiisediminis]TWI58923.1 RNAse Z [Halalkalibacter nanhaiisediminis]